MIGTTHRRFVVVAADKDRQGEVLDSRTRQVEELVGRQRWYRGGDGDGGGDDSCTIRKNEENRYL